MRTRGSSGGKNGKMTKIRQGMPKAICSGNGGKAAAVLVLKSG